MDGNQQLTNLYTKLNFGLAEAESYSNAYGSCLDQVNNSLKSFSVLVDILSNGWENNKNQNINYPALISIHSKNSIENTKNYRKVFRVGNGELTFFNNKNLYNRIRLSLSSNNILGFRMFRGNFEHYFIAFLNEEGKVELFQALEGFYNLKLWLYHYKYSAKLPIEGFIELINCIFNHSNKSKEDFLKIGEQNNSSDADGCLRALIYPSNFFEKVELTLNMPYREKVRKEKLEKFSSLWKINMLNNGNYKLEMNLIVYEMAFNQNKVFAVEKFCNKFEKTPFYRNEVKRTIK